MMCRFGVIIVLGVGLLAQPSIGAEAGLGQEHRDPAEQQQAKQMIRLIKTISEQRSQGGRVKRFNQAKSLGCFEADFSINDKLPAKLSRGLFKQPGNYRAMIRFANASEIKDNEKDLRGMSIKVFDVAGPSLWGTAGEQHFILNSYPALFVANPGDFLDFIKALKDDSLWWYFFNPFNSHLYSLKILYDARQQHNNPFDIDYWSTTPYRLGLAKDTAVKYAAKPCGDTNRPSVTVAPGSDHLSEAMQKQLSQAPACFDFMVQFQTDADEMPIEDASVIWDESESPFTPVARITIKSQPFMDDDNMAACERTGFNPWQSLSEHQPLGGINRVRKDIYEQVFSYREAINRSRGED